MRDFLAALLESNSLFRKRERPVQPQAHLLDSFP